MRSPVLLLPILAALAGCASDAPTGFVSRVDTSSPETTPVSGADASMMLVQMPQPGGLVTKVREKSYANGISQQAILGGEVSGLGENHLEIYVQTSASNGAAGLLNIGPPSESGMKREILARYPKVPMRIVTQPRQNSLGVFGLAIGRASNGARCVFAWQWVDDIRRGGSQDSGFSIMGRRFGGSSSAAGATPASIRVHLCRKDATVDDLAATVEGMTLASPAIIQNALNPARRIEATAPVRDAGPNRGSTVIASAAPAGSLESALGPQKQTQVASDETPKRKRATHVARRKAAPAPQEAEEGVVVARRQAPVEQQPQPVYGGGPRYLAPVAGMPTSAPVVYGTPAPVASAAPTTAGLDPSLPAAAYRGPSSRPRY
ncbi:MAG: cellulose biosynthesis protein BcsN [Rhodoblastus sp.]|nr:cellulose biosynthesis protein BcsN [Rhodoblastus sp.]